MLENLTAADFSERQGATFRLTTEGGESVDAVLAEVVEHGEREDMRDPFSLHFSTDPDADLPQGTYKVEQDEAEPIDLFLVPVGPGQLEAVFG